MLGVMQRWWYRWRCSDEALDYCLGASSDSRASFADSDLIAIDLETTGLDTQSAEIASIGWVEIHGGVIKLNTMRHVLVRVEQGVQQSATIHEITDSDLTEAVALDVAMDALLQACRGKVLVFHNAALDYTMLSAATRALYNMPLLMKYIDTLALEKSGLMRKKGYIAADGLRLHACRDRYHLPRSRAHNAALDALATAELLLAIVEYKGGAARVSMRSLLRPV